MKIDCVGSCEESVRTVCLILLVGCGRPPTVPLALIASLAVQSITSLCWFFVFVRSFCSGSRRRSTSSWGGTRSLFAGWLLSTSCTLFIRPSRRNSSHSGAAVFICGEIKFAIEVVAKFLFLFFFFFLGLLRFLERGFSIFC